MSDQDLLDAVRVRPDKLSLSSEPESMEDSIRKFSQRRNISISEAVRTLIHIGLMEAWDEVHSTGWD